MPSRLSILETVSDPAGVINDDRIGHRGNLAWVIDGATDLHEERLLPGGSDAAWLAAEIDAELRRLEVPDDQPLSDLLARLTATLAGRFAAAARRQPRGPGEQPSAAGIILRLAGERLDYLSLADCQLVLAAPGRPAAVLGVDPELEAGDQRAVEVMRAFRASSGTTEWRAARQHLLPRIRSGRDRLNQPDGYGVFSITPPPAHLVRQGTIAAPPGSRLLLASDGFTRLAEVFRRYPTGALVEEAGRRGLAAMLAELRGLERDDPECLAYTRTKPHDDASALLAEVRPAAG